MVMGVAGVYLALFAPADPTLQQAGAIYSVISALACVLVLRIYPGRPFTAGFVYLFLFTLFHGGLLVSTALGQEVDLINDRDSQWYYTNATTRAAIIASWAVVAFTAGYSALTRRAKPSDRRDQSPTGTRALAGPILTLAGVVWWFAIALVAGVSLFGSTYTTWLTLTETLPTPYVYLVMGIGMGAAGASRATLPRRLALTAFVLFAIPAFLIGLRGEVIIPAAAYLVAMTRRRNTRLRWWMAVVPLVALSAGSYVRATRTTTSGTAMGTLDDANPLHGLTELGYTIRPLSLVVDRLAAGEENSGWETYLSPFKRLIGENIFGMETLGVLENDAVFRTFVTDRVGPIGGSPAAEAYRAFGLTGAIIVLAAIGLLLAFVENRPISTANDALIGMLAFPLYLWIRNDFTPVPLSMAVVLVLWLLVYHRPSMRPDDFASDRPQEL
ncbi:O-antigen polysaccharide polymerase Wzy [Kytococcus sedentarius]|uniref:O-antigen polysaccharide polymerase Wzy n=1 Tax=Kytococcus sedentarius TaxID=1276 RepID=UPI00384AF684